MKRVKTIRQSQEATQSRSLTLETLSPLGPELSDDQLTLIAGGRNRSGSDSYTVTNIGEDTPSHDDSDAGF